MIKRKYIRADAVSGDKILLRNAEALRSENASGESVDLMKLDAEGLLQFVQMPRVSSDPVSGNELSRKTYVDAQIALEAAARLAADETLQGSVSSEAAARLAADETLQGNIDAEATARADADGALDARVIVLESFSASSVTKEYVDSQDSALDARLDIVEGDSATPGSVAKAYADSVSYTDQKIAEVVNGAPEVLDTLKELADALGSDANFSATVAGQIGDLDSRLDLLEGGVEIAGSVANLIAAEEASRIAEDQTLQGNIDAEATARAEADTALQASIDASKATRALDNLENVAINTSLVPDMGMTHDLGSDMNTWMTVHADAVQLGSGIKTSMSQTVLDMSQAGMGVVTLQDPGANYKVELSNGVSLLSGGATGFKIGNGSGMSPYNSTEVLGSLYSDGISSSLGMSNGAGFEGAYLTNLYANDGADPVASFSSTMSSKLKAGAVDTRVEWGINGLILSGFMGPAIDVDFGNAGVVDFQRKLESVSHVDIGSETHYFNAGHFQRVYGGRDVMSLEPLAPVDSHELVNKAYVDSEISGAVAAEETARLTAEGILQSNIDAEAAARADADAVLQAAINAEESARIAAVSAEESARIAAVSAEESARIAADNALSARIDAVISNTDPAALDSLSEVVAAFEAADSDLNAAISALGTGASSALADEIARAEAAEAALQADIDAEETARIAADGAEATARADADAVLQAAIDTEATARAAADATLQGNIDTLDAALDAEVADRIAAVAAEASARATADSVEEAARIAGDASVLVDAKAYTDAQLDTLVVFEQSYESFTLSTNLDTITVSASIVGTPWIMSDGLMARPGIDFTFSGDTITWAGDWHKDSVVSPRQAGDVIHVYFMKSSSPFLA